MGLHFNVHPWRLDDFGIPPWRNRNFHRMIKLWSLQPPFFYGGPSLTEFCGFLGPRVVTGPLSVVFILLVDLPVFGTWCLNFNFSRDSHGEIPMFIYFHGTFHVKSHMKPMDAMIKKPGTSRPRNRQRGRIFSGYSLVGHSLGGLVARVIAVHVDLTPRNLAPKCYPLVMSK